MGGKKKKLERLKRELAKAQRLAGYGVGGLTIPYALVAETDRGCALVAGEFVSDALEALLRVKFEKEATPKEIVEALIGSFTAPLGTLAMRAAACRAFGLITQDTYEAIDQIREIRNACGHRKGAIDLQDNEIGEYVRWLIKYVARYPTLYPDGRYVEGWPWWNDLGTDVSSYSRDRMAFMNAVCSVVAFIRAHEFYLEADRQYSPIPVNPTPHDEPARPQE